MAKTMALMVTPASISTGLAFDDLNGKPRRSDFHNRLERRAEDGTLYVSIFSQKLLVESTVVMDEADKDLINSWHAAGTSLKFYDKWNIGAGTSSVFDVMLLGQQRPGAVRWTRVGDWYQMALRIAEE